MPTVFDGMSQAARNRLGADYPSAFSELLDGMRRLLSDTASEQYRNENSAGRKPQTLPPQQRAAAQGQATGGGGGGGEAAAVARPTEDIARALRHHNFTAALTPEQARPSLLMLQGIAFLPF